MSSTSSSHLDRPQQARFATTEWSLILSAADHASPRFRQSLAELCQKYWYPLYAFVRRQGNAPAEAEDLTQEFFLRLVEKDYLEAAGPEKGKFRTFMLVCLRRFLANEHDRKVAQKRGGQSRLVSIDLASAESSYQLEPVESTTPEHIFERRWALALLDCVVQRLQGEYAAAGKQPLFNELKVFLVMEDAPSSYADLSRRMQLSEGALKVAVHRLRKRYGQLLSVEVTRTLDGHSSVRDEINELIAALGRPN
jgi:RNA polymerase sigma-70 factor (ECF subfamily)